LKEWIIENNKTDASCIYQLDLKLVNKKKAYLIPLDDSDTVKSQNM
jgi:hypothetical protein